MTLELGEQSLGCCPLTKEISFVGNQVKESSLSMGRIRILKELIGQKRFLQPFEANVISEHAPLHWLL